MKTSLSSLLIAFGLGLQLFCPQLVLADGGGGSQIQTADPAFAEANMAIQDRDWNRAIDLLNTTVARDATNADAYNLLGYAERQRGSLDAAFKHYEQALALDPDHRGAHEYIGEAYLLADNLSKAEEHLARLDKLCFFSCEEYRDLKAAIAEYKRKRAN